MRELKNRKRMPRLCIRQGHVFNDKLHIASELASYWALVTMKGENSEEEIEAYLVFAL